MEEKRFLEVVVTLTVMVKAMTVKAAAAVPRVAEPLRRSMTAATRTVAEAKP